MFVFINIIDCVIFSVYNESYPIRLIFTAIQEIMLFWRHFWYLVLLISCKAKKSNSLAIKYQYKWYILSREASPLTFKDPIIMHELFRLVRSSELIILDIEFFRTLILQFGVYEWTTPLFSSTYSMSSSVEMIASWACFLSSIKSSELISNTPWSFAVTTASLALDILWRILLGKLTFQLQLEKLFSFWTFFHPLCLDQFSVQVTSHLHYFSTY